MPEKVWILQMDEENKVIAKEEYHPKEMPDALSMKEDTAYILMEVVTENGACERKLFDKNDTYLESFYGLANGMLNKKVVELAW